jgi:hypothetical protein
VVNDSPDWQFLLAWMAKHMLFRLLYTVLNNYLLSPLLVLFAVCGVVASSSRKELIQMMVIGQTALAAVSSKAKAFVTTSNKRFCMIERQFGKYGKRICQNVSRAVKYYHLSADLTNASAQHSFGISIE